jgi:hypothetical protein
MELVSSALVNEISTVYLAWCLSLQQQTKPQGEKQQQKQMLLLLLALVFVGLLFLLPTATGASLLLLRCC